MYNLKLYDYDWTLKQTISPKLMKSDIKFYGNINASQGNLSMALNLPITNNDFTIWNIVEIWLYNDDNKDWRLIYTGWITDIKRIADTNKEEVEINCLWMMWFLGRKRYRDSWNAITFTENIDPGDAIIAIIDQINAQYPWNWLSYSEWLVQNYGTNLDLSYDKTKCTWAIGVITETTQWDFYIRPDWQVIFRPTPTIPTHILTYKKHIESIDIEETSDDMVNRLFLYSDNVAWSYNDATSQTDYGLFEDDETDSKWNNQPTIDLAGDNGIEERKNPLRNITIVVNQEYDIFSIYPWDTISIVNTDYPIKNAKVIKTSFNNNKLTINLERYVGIGKRLLSLVNKQ